jgi:hypothetical protein
MILLLLATFALADPNLTGEYEKKMYRVGPTAGGRSEDCCLKHTSGISQISENSLEEPSAEIGKKTSEGDE